jgi:hemerythrin-like domain-containing protein
MKATDTLKSEHRVIEKVLLALENVARKTSEPFPEDVFTGALTFLRQYADARHHGKEEKRLFPLLQQRGLPTQGGPVACMLNEHDLGRALLLRVEKALPSAAQGDSAARREVEEAYLGFVSLLRDHIKKEDQILFNMADNVLTPEDQKALEVEFAEFDATREDADLVAFAEQFTLV